jgi:GntR family transcriptional regulator
MSVLESAPFTRAHLKTVAAGPLYLKLRLVIEAAIAEGTLKPGDALPTEREIAEQIGVSRVTVRKAFAELAEAGLLVRRHGSGTFIAPNSLRPEQHLSLLTSFTEDMERRGLRTRAEWIERGIFSPSPDEMMNLGLPSTAKVARFHRLRIADDTPLALEWSSVSAEFIPDPETVTDSLYRALERRNARPTRAIQRISALNIDADQARLLQVEARDAGLFLERVSYLPSGRVVELTHTLYRGDVYDFVAELTTPGKRL